MKNGEERGSVKWLSGLDQALHEYFETFNGHDESARLTMFDIKDFGWIYIYIYCIGGLCSDRVDKMRIFRSCINNSTSITIT